MKTLCYFSMGLVCVLSATMTRAESTPKFPGVACCSSNGTAAPRLTDKSLYQIESTWTNDEARPLKLRALKGRPQILTMFFAHCNYACPLLVQQMKQIEARLPKEILNNIGFVLVSFDTERDTPQALADYRRQHALAAERWTILRGEYDDVLELSALIGVKFKKDASGNFMHSNVITLLNSDGEIAFQQTGLKFEPDEFISRLKLTEAK